MYFKLYFESIQIVLTKQIKLAPWLISLLQLSILFAQRNTKISIIQQALGTIHVFFSLKTHL